jgi:nucleoside-diphosphate-sugar epimerase
MRNVLITGGAGFFGDLLKRRLLDEGFRCTSIDLEADEFSHPNLDSVQGDIRDRDLMNRTCEDAGFEGIFHCAAILAHGHHDHDFLWSSNVDGTRVVAETARDQGIPKIVFTSSNCLWGEAFDRPVQEDDAPNPVEIYGKSKWEAEKVLEEYQDDVKSVSIRCPTIMDAGRLGLLAILFEFIDEGRKVWVVGGGDNRYQFIYGQDLATACILALDYDGPHTVFNIGSDDVRSFREVYEYVIEKAGTKARVARLPKGPAIAMMKLAYALKLSPLGPYQYKMIAESFVFDTSRIKAELDWEPTVTNEEMLYKAYKYYHDHLDEIRSRKNVSAHKQAADMGIIKVLKWFS